MGVSNSATLPLPDNPRLAERWPQIERVSPFPRAIEGGKEKLAYRF